jgi:hypothetical protein
MGVAIAMGMNSSAPTLNSAGLIYGSTHGVEGSIAYNNWTSNFYGFIRGGSTSDELQFFFGTSPYVNAKIKGLNTYGWGVTPAVTDYGSTSIVAVMTGKRLNSSASNIGLYYSIISAADAFSTDTTAANFTWVHLKDLYHNPASVPDSSSPVGQPSVVSPSSNRIVIAYTNSYPQVKPGWPSLGVIGTTLNYSGQTGIEVMTIDFGSTYETIPITQSYQNSSAIIAAPTTWI